MHVLFLGALILVGFYVAIHFLYSVTYMGSSRLYGSPLTQALFPGQPSLFPTWGYDPFGFLRGEKTKYGQDSFWPNFLPFQASKKASGGVAPEGGLRDARHASPVTLRDGYDELPMISDIYERSSLPNRTVWPIGWWGA